MSRSAIELLSWAAEYVDKAANDLESCYAVGGIGGPIPDQDEEDAGIRSEIAECRAFVIEAREAIK